MSINKSQKMSLDFEIGDHPEDKVFREKSLEPDCNTIAYRKGSQLNKKSSVSILRVKEKHLIYTSAGSNYSSTMTLLYPSSLTNANKVTRTQNVAIYILIHSLSGSLIRIQTQYTSRKNSSYFEQYNLLEVKSWKQYFNKTCLNTRILI